MVKGFFLGLGWMVKLYSYSSKMSSYLKKPHTTNRVLTLRY